MRNDSRVLISGAGVAGLACGLWLAKHGFQPVVVEKARSIRAGGFIVALSHHAYHFAGELDLLEKLAPYDVRIAASSYHDATGSTLLELDYQKLFKGVDIIQLMRDDLVRVQYEAARECMELRFADQIAGLDQNGEGVDVTFASGRQETFDVVIGADGLHSAVRQQAFLEGEIIEFDLGLNCAAYRLPNVLNIERKFETHMERNRYMAVFNTLEGDIGSVFVWENPDANIPDGPKRADLLENAYRDTTPSIARVLASCPQDETFYMDHLMQIEMPRWHKGRVALLGDAGHCLTLFSGRGAAAAFAGACRLARSMVAHDWPTAAARYQAEMGPVIADIQPATRSAVRWYVPRTPFNHILRNGLMRFVPSAIFRRYFRAKYSRV